MHQISGEVVRKLREGRGWTQEVLAHQADLSVKTIQRVEKGEPCMLETRSALAAVFQVDVKQLQGEQRIEQATASSGNDVLFFGRMLSGETLASVIDGTYYYRYSNEEARSSEDNEVMASAVATINDWSEIWHELEPSSKIKATFEMTELLKDIEQAGLWVFGLRTKANFKFPNRDGRTVQEGAIANFHIAYADSDRIIVLDPKA